MKRRTVLRRVGGGGLVGLGGCVSAPTTASRSTTSRSITSPPADVQRRVSIAEQDAVPAEHRFRIEATVREPAVTDSHTARIRVSVTNEGPARGVAVSTGRCALFNRYSQTSTPRGVWLGLADDPVYVAQSGPRWVASPPEDGAFPDYGCARRTYETGESVHTDYGVFHDDRTGGYLDAGTYRFAEDVVVTPAPSAERDEDALITVSWGFDLAVENPNCTLCL